VKQELILSSYTNQTYWRWSNTGLIIDYSLAFIIFFYMFSLRDLSPSPNIIVLILMILFLILPFYEVTAYLLGHVLFNRRIVLAPPELHNWTIAPISKNKTYLLPSIANCYLKVAEEDKETKGLQKLTPLRNMLRIIMWGYLLDWFFSKHQQLVLLGEKGEKIGEIDVSGFYEQDIEKLVSLLKRKEIRNSL
jgi:hypothetical protein